MKPGISAALILALTGVSALARAALPEGLPGPQIQRLQQQQLQAAKAVLDAPDFEGNTHIELASFSAVVPFRIGGQPFSYQFGWNMQNARRRVTPPADFFVIGTRYSIRGFDQQLTLAAESGWAILNELNWYLPTCLGNQAIDAGVDAGRVRGPAEHDLVPQTLVGAVISVRGNLASKRPISASGTYDFSVGWPLSKPDGFRTGPPTLLFQVSALF